MSYNSGVVHNVFVVRWLEPAPGDMKQILDQVREAHNVYKAPLIYMAIVPEECKLPDEVTRREMADAIPELFRVCSSVHLVLEGGGIKRATMRSVATGMFLLTGKRGRAVFNESALQALQRETKLPVAPEAIIAAGRARHLFT